MIKPPIVRDLLLIGGGHSHVEVLRRFGMRPLDGVRITMVTRDLHVPYSGMLPGFIAGHYGFDDVHIDLRPLARFAGARLIHASVDGIDLDARRASIGERPPLEFDVASIDVGSAPDISIPGAADHSIPVKPINGFLAHWERLAARVAESASALHVLTVGGGAGGVELSLAVQHRLAEHFRDDPESLRCSLVTGGAEVLEAFDDRVRERFSGVFAERGFSVHTDSRVVGRGRRRRDA